MTWSSKSVSSHDDLENICGSQRGDLGCLDVMNGLLGHLCWCIYKFWVLDKVISQDSNWLTGFLIYSKVEDTYDSSPLLLFNCS